MFVRGITIVMRWVHQSSDSSLSRYEGGRTTQVVNDDFGNSQ
jgi:hypothetical protein